MSPAKFLSLSALTLGATLTLNTLLPTPAQAAIIENTISGTWDEIYFGNITPGSAFTATYSFDTDAIVPFDLSPAPDDGVHWIGFEVPLLSLVISSLDYSYTFDFTSGNTTGYAKYEEYSEPPLTVYNSVFWFIHAREVVGILEHHFNAGMRNGYWDGVFAENSPNASIDLMTSDGTFLLSAAALRNVNFPTFRRPIPTPALLPGLIALGIGALRKRKAELAVEED